MNSSEVDSEDETMTSAYSYYTGLSAEVTSNSAAAKGADLADLDSSSLRFQA